MATLDASARLERLPFRGPVLRLVLIIALGGFFELYDLFLTTYIVPTLLKDGIYSLKTANIFDMHAVASFVAALFLGMFVGAGLLGRLPDRFGRKAVFTYALIGYSVCTLVMAFQTEALWINIWRFLAAVGIGLEQVTIVTYTSELVASRYRGRAIALTQTISFVAMPVVATVSWLLIPHAFLGLEGWRWVVILGALGAVFIWVLRRALPESALWLESKGRHAEASEVLDRLESQVYGDRSPPPAAVSREAPAAPPPASLDGRRWAALFGPGVRRLVLMMVVVNVCITVGYYGFASWVPTLLVSKGITTVKSLEYSLLMAVAAPLAPLLSMLVADRIERKLQVMLSCTFCAVLGLAFAAQSVPAVVIVLGFLLTLNNGWMSSSYHTYQAELFPVAIRAQAVGFVYSWSRFSAVFCAYVISYLLARYGNAGVFAFITGSMLLIVLTLWRFGPKTNRLVSR
ncbi:MFS transporter [Bordetella trematum]|uniref:MFS transporter n=1 Tax=Bordetella trematum TaxID=123899 RepID=UPI000D9591ED|nr:MFS transporter [Bordetella trematum]SPU51635.1 transporter [Bordetella trematum]VDH08439.1 Inner membrane metabolite transport protein ydjE [Bordetella trematum]